MCALGLVWLAAFAASAAAQQSPISTSMPVPPLQWLNLTGLTHGSGPPGLRGSSIGYDDNTRTLLIFGGESQTGVPTAQTYLLNLDNLSWTTPQTAVPSLSNSPPPRSQAIGAGDFAANSRRDHVLYGGKGSNSQALGDIWCYDYLNQFWIQVDMPSTSVQPSPRWGTVGGIDPSVTPNSGNNLATTLFVAGGSDANQDFPASEIWELTITGSLASDVQAVRGVWNNASVSPHTPGRVAEGGALVSQSQSSAARVAMSGGCGGSIKPPDASLSCTDPTSYVFVTSNTQNPPGGAITVESCPAPRFAPAMAPNYNTASTSFATQVFMLLGTFNQSQWDDAGGLSKGEVAVMDASTGTWARVVPSRDPSPSSSSGVPSPRDGAVALSFPSALVGSDRSSASDTILFGGRDANGNYLSELWVLRAYKGALTSSSQQWSGFGDGTLQSGVSASGSGVTVQYLSQCAQSISPGPGSPTTSPSQKPQPTTPNSPSGSTAAPTFDTSVTHKVLAPISVAIILLSYVVSRLAGPSSLGESRSSLLYLSVLVGIAAYVAGIVGFALSLVSTRRNATLQRRDGVDSSVFLQTAHGRAGFALFIGLYGIMPLLAAIRFASRRNIRQDGKTDEQLLEGESAEKDASTPPRAASPSRSDAGIPLTESQPSSPRKRTQSGPGLYPGWRERTQSVGALDSPVEGKGSFEVTNRPRRVSAGRYPPRPMSGPGTMPRSLSDLSWLERRRSMHAVNELDYALSRTNNRSPPRSPSPPATSRPPTVSMSARPFIRTPEPQIRLRKIDTWSAAIHTLFHAFLFASCVLCLVALFTDAPIAPFIIFLLWTLVFYVAIIILAWKGRPRDSFLTIVMSRFRARPNFNPSAPTASPGSPTHEDEAYAYHGGGGGEGTHPYVHQHAWRRAVSPEEDMFSRTSHSTPGLRHMSTEEGAAPDSDDDDDTRQRQIEDEMSRRDVSIVTVPKRKLWITNPN